MEFVTLTRATRTVTHEICGYTVFCSEFILILLCFLCDFAVELMRLIRANCGFYCGILWIFRVLSDYSVVIS